MTVILLILKLIGLLLLSVLALGLLILLLVLFVPVRYRGYGSYHKELRLTLRVNWLLHLVTFGVDMLPGQNSMYVRIFGIKKNLTKADNTEEFEDTIEELADQGTEDVSEDVKQEAEAFADTSVEEAQEHSSETGAASSEKAQTSSDTDTVSDSEKPFGFIRKCKEIWERIKNLCRQWKQKLIRLKDTVSRIQRLASDERNQKAIHLIGNQVFRLLKCMMPRRLKLNLTYSTGSPDTTGELMGVLALFPIGYTQRWNIMPDFTADEFYADADFDVKGRIFFFQILKCSLTVLLDKNCRRLYNKLRSGS